MTYAATVLADSPLGYWRLGDASGTTMTDSSGSSRNGTYVGTPTLGAAGLLTGDADTAVSLNGTSQCGTVTYAAWMDVSVITLEAVVKPAAVGAYRAILDRDDAGGAAPRVFQFRMENTGKLGFIFWDSGGTVHSFVGSTVMSAGSIYHVAATFNGTTATLYINGVSDGTLSFTGSLKTGTRNMQVGSTGGTAQFYSGVIDEAAIYGTALSSTRIAAHYAAMTGGGGGGGGTARAFHIPTPLRRQAQIRSSSF